MTPIRGLTMCRTVLTLAVLFLPLAAQADDWPGWRGPAGTGVSTEKDLPVRWSDTENVRWKVPLEGAGVSTPAVAGERVVLTASDGRLNDRLHVYCYHRGDGRLLWHTRLFGSAQPEGQFPPGGMAVPTPTTDGRHVYALFGTGDLACLDLEGRPVWVRSLAQEYGPFRNRWGMAASPVLVGDLLVVLVDHWGQSYLLGVDARSGVNRWKTNRDASVNWSSPLAVRVGGRTQLVVTGTYQVRGYDAADGAELWRTDGMEMQCIPSPVSEGGLVYAVSGRKGYTLAIRLDGSRGSLTGKAIAWKSKRGAPYVPSPVCYQGRYYLVEDEGFGTCLDAATGAEVWRERLGGRYQASPVAGGGKVYYTNLEGVVTVVRAGPKFEVLSRNRLGESIVASPAVSDGQLFLRGEKHLFCIGPPRADRAEKATPERKPLSVQDLYRFDAPTAFRLSPDGSRGVYVRQWVDATSKQRRHSLWLTDARGGPRPVEDDQPDAVAPVFSPDGKWLAFLSSRPRPSGWKQTPPVPPASDPATDVWLVSSDGGHCIPLAGPDKPYGRVLNDGFYGRLSFSPDGRRLAFIADDGKDARTPEEIEANVEVVRPDQGERYTGYGAAQLWVAHLDERPGQWAASRVERLTDDDVWYGDPQWSPEGQTLVVHANKTADRESVRFSINKNFDLWAVDVNSRRVRQLTTGPGPEVSPRFSPDGRRLACLSIPRKGSHMDIFNLTLVTLGDGGPRTEVLLDHHDPALRQPAHPAPSFPLPEACWDGADHLVYNAAQGTRTASVRLDLKTGTGELEGKRAVKKKDQAAPPPGNVFLKERLLADSQVVAWENEGHTLEGVLTLPPASVAKAPHKLVVYPHGGPHSRSAVGFDFTVQVLAGRGYAVFQPNFRGSGGYGQQFINADRHDFGGGDMRDILTGVDALVKRGLVDRDRQFVYGVSYGGFMTSWLVGHTHQFRAAVAQNAVTDLNAMWGLSDLQSWTEWEFGGRPWEVPEAMRRHSPLTYAAHAKTPTLILHARDDRRCPLPMGRMFYQALQARGVDTQLVIYPDEGHGISQPRHQEDVLRRILGWFERHERNESSFQDRPSGTDRAGR